jgi:Na+/H+ antiporter NhaC
MSLSYSESNLSVNTMNVSKLCNQTFNQSNEEMITNTDCSIYEVNLTNTTDLSDYPDLTQLSYVRIIFLLLYVIVMFFALFGNFVVCYTVLSSRKMQSIVNCYLVNLAFIDFIIGAFVLPVKFIELNTNWYTLSNGWCNAMLYLQTVIVFASVLTLVATCLER